MKKLLLVCIFTFMVYSPFSVAETLWKKSNGISQSIHINGLTVTSENTIFLSSQSSLFRSKNNGTTWEKIKLPDDKLNNIFSYCNIVPDKYDNLFILKGQTLYKLENMKDTAEILLTFDYEDYDNCITISEDNKKVIVKNAFETWISNDSGESWKQVNSKSNYSHLFMLSSVDYDENFKIIHNYDSGSDKWNFVYQSTDDGETWHQIVNIPGTNTPIGSVRVIDDDLWIIGNNIWGNNIYNFKTNLITPIDFFPKKFYKTDLGIYISDYEKIYFSSDSGITWSDITGGSYKDFNIRFVDNFFATKSGKLYVGTRNGLLIISEDNGLTWTTINVIDEETPHVNYIKNAGDKIYATIGSNLLYVSTDYGQNWATQKLQNLKTPINGFDVNNKGEMVYNDSSQIYYSSDWGASWVPYITLNSDVIPKYGIKILDNGYIFINDDFSNSSVYKFPGTDKIATVNFDLRTLQLLDDGKYLILRSLQIVDKDFKNAVYFKSIGKIVNQLSNYNNYCISRKGEFYVATSHGIFKSNTISDNFELIAFLDSNVNNIFVDDNDYIYITLGKSNPRLGERILLSKDGGISWEQINSNLGVNIFEFFFVWDNQKILVKTDKIFFAELDNINKLNLSTDYFINKLYFNSNIEIPYTLLNKNGLPVESARVIVNNSLTPGFDTLYTDSNGKVIYSKKFDYLNPNFEKLIDIYAIAEKENFIASEVVTLSGHYYAYKNELFTELDSNIIFTIPNEQVNIKIKLRELLGDSHVNADGTLLIKNLFSKDEFTIPYNKLEYYEYSFTVPSNPVYGVYRISINAINNQGDSASETTLNLVVFDEYPLTILSVKQMTDDINNFIISPNPATDFITIQFQTSEVLETSEVYQVQIFDMLGIEIISELIHPMTGSHRMNVEKLPTGVYYIRIGNKVEKFVKF